MIIHAQWKAPTCGALLVLCVAAETRGQEPPAATIPYTQRHAVFKPALNIPTRKPLMETGFEFPTKPLFIKGYAGNLYGQGPREAYIPTGYGTGTIQAVGSPATVPAARPGLFGRLRRCR